MEAWRSPACFLTGRVGAQQRPVLVEKRPCRRRGGEISWSRAGHVIRSAGRAGYSGYIGQLSITSRSGISKGGRRTGASSDRTFPVKRPCTLCRWEPWVQPLASLEEGGGSELCGMLSGPGLGYDKGRGIDLSLAESPGKGAGFGLKGRSQVGQRRVVLCLFLFFVFVELCLLNCVLFCVFYVALYCIVLFCYVCILLYCVLFCVLCGILLFRVVSCVYCIELLYCVVLCCSVFCLGCIMLSLFCAVYCVVLFKALPGWSSVPRRRGVVECCIRTARGVKDVVPFKRRHSNDYSPPGGVVSD